MDAGSSDDEGRLDGPTRNDCKKRRLSPQRVLFTCSKVAAVVLFLAVVGAGILAIRLQQGPVEIDGLNRKIESALHERFGNGLQFDLGRTSMVQKGFGPTLAADRLTVLGPNRQIILSAPRAEVSISPFALVFGRVVPKRVEVMDVTLRLMLLKNGALAVAAGENGKPFFEIGRRQETASPPASAEAARTDPQDSSAQTPPTHRAIAMKQASAAIRQFLDILTDPNSPIAAVDRLGIARGKLVIDDQLTNDEVVYSDFELAFDKSRRGSDLTLSAKGPNGRWTVAAKASGAPGGDRQFGLKAENLTIDEAQLVAGTRSLGIDTDMPIAMTADLGLKPDNTLREAAGSIKLGPGFFTTSDPDQEPFFVEEIAGAVHWNGTDRRIEVDPIRYVERDGSRFTLAGSIKAPLDEGQPWHVVLATTEGGSLVPDRKGQEAIPIDAGQFEGRLFLDRKTFQIDRLAIHGKKGGIALAGQVDWVKGPHLKIGARIDPTSIAMVQRVWPTSMASSVRAWCLDHFDTGQVTEGTIQIDYDEMALKRLRADRSPPDNSVALDFKLSKASLRYLDGVPPLDEVEGIGHITGRSSRFVLSSGKMDVAGRKIDVSDATFVVPNSNRHPTPAVLSARLSGSVEAVADVLSREALKPYASLPLDAATVHGQVEGTLEKALLFGGEGQGPDAPLRVKAKVSDFMAEHLVGSENLEKASVDIDVDAGVLKATGDGKIFGGPATFEIDRVGSEPPNATINVTLDDAARTRVGLPPIPGVSGPMTAHVNASLGDPSKIKAQVDLDLAKTAVAAAYLGVNKPAGRPGKISFAINPRDNKLSIDQLAIDIASLQARGAIELGSDNGFRSARFSSLKVSPGDDMRVDISKGQETFKLTIRGSTIDARPFLKGLTSTPTNDNSTPLSRSAKAEKKEVDSFKGYDIDLKAGLLSGFNKEVMNAVDLKLSKRGSQYRQFSIKGRFGGAAVSGSMGANQRLNVSAQDAGALVSFIDLYKHMESGNLAASLQIGDDALDGKLEIRDFVLRDEPAIRRLVAQSEAGAPSQDGRAPKRINASAVGFKQLKVNFQREGSRLALSDATMYGNEIGLSVDGWLDYVHDRVSMTGTFVPVFAFNNMFAQIPVLGVLLGGKSNEGLFAITFRISGLASTPTLSVNPLSAVTPGFLRNIFGVLDAGGERPPEGASSYAEPAR